MYRVLGLLDRVKKSGTGYEASCPGPRHKHDDKHPSLSVGLGYDGRVLLSCKAGCDTAEVLAALSMSWADLFEHSPTGHPVRRFRLLNSNGAVVAEHVREELPGDKRIWWEHSGKRGLNGVALEDLPLYRLPDVLAADRARPVIVTEGEKAADALADLGLLVVGTVTGAAGTPSEVVLSALRDREVWLWPDNDIPGQEHMQRIASRLPSARWIDWPAAPPKGDAADYVAADGTAEGVSSLLRRAPVATGPRIWRGDELAVARFSPVRWAIPGILPSGLTILAGRPKLGKSWLALGWSLDIPAGRPVLRKIEVAQGEALYLALEDSPRRMQERQALLLGDATAHRGFHMATEWPRQNEGGLELLDEWIRGHPDARMVIIDTFKRFRPKETKALRLYDLDYDALSPLAALAMQHNIAIVIVFHTNKSDPVDPIDLISGTLGLSGCADGVLVLKRERGQADASLFVTGRDIKDETDLALKWERDDVLGWTLLGQAEDFRRSKERQEILNAITSMPGMGPVDIASAIGKKPGAVRYLLFAMTRDGDVRVRDGKYFPSTTPNTPNTPKSEIKTAPKTVSGPRGTPNTPNTSALITPLLTPNSVSADRGDSTIRAVSAVRGLCHRCGRDWDTHGSRDPISCQWQDPQP